MTISRIHGLRYGTVLFPQASPTANLTLHLRAVRANNECIRFIANDLHPTSRRSRLAKSRWVHYRPRSLFPAVRLHGGRPLPNYFTSYSPRLFDSNQLAVELPTLIEEEPDEPPLTPYDMVQDKEWSLQFVDYYDGASVDEQLQMHNDPYHGRYAPADGPKLVISDKPEDVELQTIDGDEKLNDERFEPAQDLLFGLLARRRQPASISLDTIWNLYLALPEPRPTFITARTRASLLGALSSVERKDEKSMLRYFAVVQDIKSAGFSLTTSQWNGAISFATRYVAKTTETELEAGLKIWRDMEREAGLTANEVTFNILFDAASKAGKFKLAEMIYGEMTRRGFVFNRFHHVSLIHFFGLKLDSSGVRAGYKDMIEAGEIVDTVVLNCLIASFIRCGEESSAEHVYEKMKQSTKRMRTMPHRDYTMGRAITKVLMMFTGLARRHPSLLSGFQNTALLAPDLSTYRILLNHYGLRLGDLSKVAQFLDEMAWCKVPLNGAIFLILFKSFARHGGTGSPWSSQRLNSVWHAFIVAMDMGAEGMFISPWLAEAILEAHAKYATKDELLNIYECLQTRWDLEPTGASYVLHMLQKLLHKTGLQSAVPPWKR